MGVVTESITPAPPIVGKEVVEKTTPLNVIGSPPLFKIEPPITALVALIKVAVFAFIEAIVELPLVVKTLSGP